MFGKKMSDTQESVRHQRFFYNNFSGISKMRKQFWIIILAAVILLPAVGQGESFDNPRSSEKIEQRANIVPNTKGPKDNYHMFGATYGYPDLINLLYGYQFDKIGFRISGGTILWTFGLKGSIVYNIFKSEHTEHSLAITTAWSSGFSQVIPEGNSYGVTYSINLFGLFAEFGVGRTIDVYKEIFFIGQVGYVWRFN